MNWTNEEKRILLQAIHDHGANDIDMLQSYLPYRLSYQIHNLVRHYKMLARASLNERTKKPEAKLEEWRNCLEIRKHATKSRHLKEDLVGRALKYIDYFEKKPQSDNVQSSSEYLMALMEGTIPKPTTHSCRKALYKLTKQLANELKTGECDRMTDALKNVGSNQNKSNIELNDDCVSKYLMSQLANPFQIPLDALQITKS